MLGDDIIVILQTTENHRNNFCTLISLQLNKTSSVCCECHLNNINREHPTLLYQITDEELYSSDPEQDREDTLTVNQKVK